MIPALSERPPVFTMQQGSCLPQNLEARAITVVVDPTTVTCISNVPEGAAFFMYLAHNIPLLPPVKYLFLPLPLKVVQNSKCGDFAI